MKQHTPGFTTHLGPACTAFCNVFEPKRSYLQKQNKMSLSGNEGKHDCWACWAHFDCFQHIGFLGQGLSDAVLIK